MSNTWRSLAMWNTWTVRAIAREAGVSDRSVRRLYWGGRQRTDTRARILMACRKLKVTVQDGKGGMRVPGVALYAVRARGAAP